MGCQNNGTREEDDLDDLASEIVGDTLNGDIIKVKS